MEDFIQNITVLQPEIDKQIRKLQQENLLERFQTRDVTLWSLNATDQQEISHRLAWLDAPEQDEAVIRDSEQLLAELLQEGYTHELVLGMGGSSLAPEVYSEFLRHFKGESVKGLSLSILDSTSPEQIQAKQTKIPLANTLFIISSKSGSTVEVNTLFAYFWSLIEESGEEDPGKHFIAISDPDTRLQKMAKEKNFRRVFQANPDVGGRYSALIAFGLVPAILAGINGYELLNNAKALSLGDQSQQISLDHPGISLGVILGSAYLAGRDKLTILAEPKTEALGSWIEQLIAESSGKSGKGMLPVDNEPLLPADGYSQDRLFVYLRADGILNDHVKVLIAKNQPVVTFHIHNKYDLAREFYQWEVATAVACAIMDVNAFDQPNVQESKDVAKKIIASLKSGKEIESKNPVWKNEQIELFSNSLKAAKHDNINNYLWEFLGQRKPGDCICINAFLPRNARNERKLQEMRKYLGEKTELPTTLGFGPRFLHSTGQLHKGGKNNGLFIVLSQEEDTQLPIPGESITFSDLIYAQALGDSQALESHQRRVVRLHFVSGEFNRMDLKGLFS